MDFVAQLTMLLFWLLRLMLGLSAAFAAIVLIDRWWLKGFDTMGELRKGNYAVAAVIAVVIYSCVRIVG